MTVMSEPGLRERKKQRTRQAISDAAIRLFVERGFDAVSVAEVAAAAEVSKPTLFNYFPTKEDLVLHRFADHVDESARVVRERAELSPLDALHQHFLAGLRERDPITGLCDAREVLAFSGLVYGTPALVARLSQFADRSTRALADELRTATGADDLTCLLAAGQITTVLRLLALENHRLLAEGRGADERHPDAVREAGRGFDLLRAGLAACCG
ncbi:TetR family transcriptional regulator [Saccharopolyspora erythraea]|uniref:TetR/AcrR family transcriptional regulator n=1 Tax=Saccharopolyspora erythraea TaxID=1836 RepID=UPI001BAB14C8|nr:TetR family transcriptional regulator [Saccharopolyspora erythraea]QUH02613.1 TetR family transcriptional regulator [Saccharopolyspora erythraea]